MKPDFNRLHVFYQVYRYKTIAEAAHQLFVTQSAVSQNLQKLEEELSFLLFHRLHKKLIPTPAGEKLYQSILPFYSMLDANIRDITTSTTNPTGNLRLGAPPVFGAEILPQVIAEFRKKYPKVTFHLTLGSQSAIAHACCNNEVDIALVDIFDNKEEESWNLIKEPLFDEPLVLVGSAKYINRNIKRDLTFEKIASCQFVAYQVTAPELFDWFMRYFKRVPKNLNIVLTVENVHAVIGAVKNHLGLGIAPLYLVKNAIQKREVAVIRIGKDEVKSRISLLRQNGKNAGVAEKLFVEFLKSKVGNHIVKEL